MQAERLGHRYCPSRSTGDRTEAPRLRELLRRGGAGLDPGWPDSPGSRLPQQRGRATPGLNASSSRGGLQTLAPLSVMITSLHISWVT